MQEITQFCLDCDRPATWVRRTQFSGDHPFCEEHARQEQDFGQEHPSYFFWQEIVPRGEE
jgi:hypothetical protein